MARNKKQNEELPKELIVYVCDRSDGETILCVAKTFNELGEEYEDQTVGIYQLIEKKQFKINRELI